MTRTEINTAIAKMLGFEDLGGHWSFPDGWPVYSTPAYHIPDFIRLIETMRDNIKANGIIPFDHQSSTR